MPTNQPGGRTREGEMATKDDVVFTRTPLGQFFYDVCMSRLSAAEVARRYRKNGVTREEVLKYRKTYPEFRPTKGRNAVAAKASHKPKPHKISR